MKKLKNFCLNFKLFWYWEISLSI